MKISGEFHLYSLEGLEYHSDLGKVPRVGRHIHRAIPFCERCVARKSVG